MHTCTHVRTQETTDQAIGVSTWTGPHHAVIQYSGPIAQVGADHLEDALLRCRNYYYYKAVDIRWESDGGCVHTMRRIMGLMNLLRGEGVRITTSTSTKACSAAAVLLSAGHWGHRHAKAHTLLVYHRAGWSASSGRITESEVNRMSAELKHIDSAMIDMLLFSGLNAVGANGLRDTVTDRCQWLHQHWSDVAHRHAQLGGDAWWARNHAKPPSWLQPSRLERLNETPRWLTAYRGMLAQIMSEDQPMSPLQAWCWGLIDAVDGVVDHGDAEAADCLPLSAFMDEDASGESPHA